MAKKRKQTKQTSPGSLIFMAIVAYVAGFPLWVVALLVAAGFILWRMRKQQKSLESLPLPPAKPSEETVESITQSPADPIVQSKRSKESVSPPPFLTEGETQQTPLEVVPAKNRSTTSADRPAPQAASRSTSRPTPLGMTSDSPYGSWAKPRQTHAMAKQLQTKSGLRQAIIAITVLGQPRSLEPYQGEPQARTNLTPPRVR